MKYLDLTEEQFDSLYPSLIDYKHIFNSQPDTDNEFIEYAKSKLWRLNNLYKIIDKFGIKCKFRMNYAQHVVYSESLLHPRVIILKSRQQGISTFWLISFLDDALINKDFSIGLMAQGKDEAQKLIERVKLAWDELPQLYKNLINVHLVTDNKSEYKFSNGSSVFIRTSFRSTTLQRLHISEFGKIANKTPDRARETNTGTLQTIAAGNIAAIESTAEGANLFKDKWDSAVACAARGVFGAKDFRPIFLSWVTDPDCNSDSPEEIGSLHQKYFDELEEELNIKLTDKQKWFWIMQYRELGDDIKQEYPGTPEEAFSASRDGTYYNRLYQRLVVKRGREVDDIYDPNLDVYVAMDIGMNDDTVLLFFQYYRGSIRIIDEFIDCGEALKHYTDYMWSLDYPIMVQIGPHDLNVRELTYGKTREERLVELGCSNLEVLDKTASISDDIEIVREYIEHIWIAKKCVTTIEAFKKYTKEWDDRVGVWKNKPLHNEHSHPMDAIRYLIKWVDNTHGNVKSSEDTESSAITTVVDGMSV